MPPSSDPPARTSPSPGPPPAVAPTAVLERYRPGVLAELHRLLDGRRGSPYDLMRYHLGWENGAGATPQGQGGKLLRPALCLLSTEAVGGKSEASLPAAAAIELLHNFTLIHDDVEDESRERHGRATLWTVRGMAEAINAGDGMFALAHVAVLRLVEGGQPPERVLRVAAMLDEATLRLCEGQHLDLLHARQGEIGLEEYLSMIEGKTASLLAASCAVGATLGDASDSVVEALREFGRRLGLAFQIRDDYLGVWGDPRVTGKAASDDLRTGKKSYPVVLALERADGSDAALLRGLLEQPARDAAAVERARQVLERSGARVETEHAAAGHAAAAIEALDIDLDAERRQELESLARFAAARQA